MGFFDRLCGDHAETDEPAAQPTPPGRQTYDVSDRDGNARRYSDDDFDEIYATLDEQEMRRLVGIGWLLLDEVAGAGEGPERIEFAERPSPGSRWVPGVPGTPSSMTGSSWHSVPITVPGEELTGYVLGHLRVGATGRPL